MKVNIHKFGVAICVISGLSACVSAPEFMDMPELPAEFVNADTANLQYGSASDLPAEAVSFRSAQQWDADAKALQDKATAFEAVNDGTAPDPATLDARREALREQLNAYKLDDPQ